MGTTPSLGLSAPAQHLRSGERQHEAAPRPQVLSTLLRTGAGRRWRPEAPGDRPQGDSSWSCGGAAADPARHRSCSRRCRPGAGPDSARFGAPRGWVCVTSAAAPLPQGAVTGPAYGAGPGRLPHPGALNKPAPRGWGCWRLGGAGPEAAPSPLEAPSPPRRFGTGGGQAGSPRTQPGVRDERDPAAWIRGRERGDEGTAAGLAPGAPNPPSPAGRELRGRSAPASRPLAGREEGEWAAPGSSPPPPLPAARRKEDGAAGAGTGPARSPPHPPGGRAEVSRGPFPPPGGFPGPVSPRRHRPGPAARSHAGTGGCTTGGGVRAGSPVFNGA